MIRKGTVGAHDLPAPVVHYDKITDGVNVLYPLALRPFELRKTEKVFEGQRGVARQCAQQLVLPLDCLGSQAAYPYRAQRFSAACAHGDHHRIEPFAAFQADAGRRTNLSLPFHPAGERQHRFLIEPAAFRGTGAMQLRLAAAQHHYAAPFRAEHPLYTVAKAVQEFWQGAAARGLAGKFHELAFALANAGPSCGHHGARGATRQLGRLISHGSEAERSLRLKLSTLFYANRPSQSESIAERDAVAYHATLSERTGSRRLSVRPWSCETHPVRRPSEILAVAHE